MADKITMSWTDWGGKKLSRVVNQTLDIRDFVGRPGYVWVFLAANCHLSYSDMLLWLNSLEWKNGVRSQSWLQRRRWLFEDPDKVQSRGTKPNADGMDEEAIEFLKEHTATSARKLSRMLLKECGIRRGKDWVLKNRCR